jgi:hypothetical protein
MNKAICECGWKGMEEELLKGKNPFDDNDLIYACPKCKGLNSTINLACDEPDCWEEVSCGTPTSNGYRRTCYKHSPK